MTDESKWDYSHIPEKSWRWHFEEDHWMDLNVGPSGLQYVGTDWTCQSGGGYFGGFQTFEEFLVSGPIQKMPEDIRKEVKGFVFENRRGGGSTLRLVYVPDVKGFHLNGVFVHLDDSPIHVMEVEGKEEMVLYDGSISTGKHVFSFVFVLKSETNMKKVTDEVNLDINSGHNEIVLITKEIADGELSTVAERQNET